MMPGREGQQSTAAPPAVSGIALTFGRDDRTGARHRLEDRQTEGLVQRGIHKQIRCLIKRAVSSSGTAPMKTTSSAMPSSATSVCNSATYFSVTQGAHDDKLTPFEFVPRQLPGTEEAVAVLVTPDGRHEQYERPCDSERSHVCPSVLPVAGL